MRLIAYLTLSTLILTLLIAPAGGAYAADRDNTDRLSANQSYTFSPGYINAAKQRAEEIVRQALENKGRSPEEKQEAVDNKIGQDIKAQQLNKPEPKLQQKSGQQDTSRPAVEATSGEMIGLSTADTTQETPAYIRSAALEYISKEGSVADQNYQIKQVNEKYFVAWYKNNCIKTQLFDSSGKALLSAPNTVTAGAIQSLNISDISVLSRGYVSMTWSESDLSNNISLKTQMFDSGGHSLNTAPVTLASGASMYGYTANVKTFSNGNVAIFWSESWQYGREPWVKAQIFDLSGSSLLAAPAVLTSPGLNSASINNILTFSNGNIGVVWSERDASYRTSLKTQIFSSNGNALLAAPSTLTGDSILNGASVTNVTTLSNGNIAVFWNESDMSNKISLKAQLFDSNGYSLLSTPTAIINNSLARIVRITNVATFSNGNISVFWSESDSNWSQSIKAQTFDLSGKMLLSAPITLTGGNSSIIDFIQDIRNLPNGNILVFWNETANGGYNYTLKAQSFDSYGHALLAAPTVLSGSGAQSNIVFSYGMTTLPNGNTVITWNECHSNSRSLKIQILDQSGKALLSAPETIGTGNMSNVTALGNGNIAVFWTGYDSKFNMRIFDSSGQALSANPTVITTGVRSWSGGPSVYYFSNGNMAIFWQTYDSKGNYFLRAQILDPSGKALLATPVTFSNNGYVDNISILSSGEIAVFWKDNVANSYKSQILDSFGNLQQSAGILKAPAQTTGLLSSSNSMLSNQLINLYNMNPLYDRQKSDFFQTGTLMLNKDVSGIFKTLLVDKNMLSQDMTGRTPPQALEMLVKDSLNRSALSLPGGYVSPEVMEMAMRLASIMRNPTEDQKMMIESIAALLQDMNKVEQEAGQSPELTKAQNELIQMVANVLLAQAMPDLITKGEMANIKNIFKELDTQKSRIMNDYNEATKPYYESIKKDIIKNMSALQLNSIFSKGMLETELKNASRSQMDEIIQKLKKTSDKFFEKDYILQQEAKYREKFLDPNKKKLEADTRTMLNEFTKQLSERLEQAKK
jgi:hypothetical protein